MWECDAALKSALKSPARVTLKALAGVERLRWIDPASVPEPPEPKRKSKDSPLVMDALIWALTGSLPHELPKLDLPVPEVWPVDLLGETPNRKLVHIELAGTNKANMAIEIARYHLEVERRLGKFPTHTVFYVGQAPLAMESTIEEENFRFRYKLIDARTLDADPLLDSADIGDNLVAVLAHMPDPAAGIRRQLKKIARLRPKARERALRDAILLAGLRNLEESVEEEARRMPLLNDALENRVLGREYQRGRKEGAQSVIRHLLRERFGPVPDWAEERLAGLGVEEFEVLAARAATAKTLEDLVGAPETP